MFGIFSKNYLKLHNIACRVLSVFFFIFVAVYIAPIYSDTEHSLTIFQAKQHLKVACNVSSTEGDVQVEWWVDSFNFWQSGGKYVKFDENANCEFLLYISFVRILIVSVNTILYLLIDVSKLENSIEKQFVGNNLSTSADYYSSPVGIFAFLSNLACEIF